MKEDFYKLNSIVIRSRFAQSMHVKESNELPFLLGFFNSVS